MRAYEIRIFPYARSQIIMEVTHVNDYAAIRAAKKLAGDSPFEVWGGLHCIYHRPDLPAARHIRLAT